MPTTVTRMPSVPTPCWHSNVNATRVTKDWEFSANVTVSRILKYIQIKLRQTTITRGQRLHAGERASRLDGRKYFFPRTMNAWNRLSADCVHSSGIDMFKNRMDNYFLRQDTRRVMHVDSR